ncbi:MAG: putative amidohydrolase [Verrucomicrobiales bacterium]|jgi:predicted amidohydrolase
MKLALAQMLVEGGRPDRNLARAGARISEVARLGADIVLLPEALDFGWTHPSARGEVDPETVSRLAKAARSSRVYVCAGFIERVDERLFNSAVLLDRDGQLLAKHRKINELEIAHDLYDCGNEANAIAETEFGRLGVQICADGFAENQWIGRDLAAAGVQGILSPCAWAVDADFDPDISPYGGIWRENYGAVTRDSGIWIAGCSNVGEIEEGPWAGRICIGNSIVFESGEEVLTGPFGVNADEVLWFESGLVK